MLLKFCLNLKGVAIKMHGRQEVTLKLNKKGPGPVTAGDIETEHDVEVVNPEPCDCSLKRKWLT